jgi:hypothetical protein
MYQSYRERGSSFLGVYSCEKLKQFQYYAFAEWNVAMWTKCGRVQEFKLYCAHINNEFRHDFSTLWFTTIFIIVLNRFFAGDIFCPKRLFLLCRHHNTSHHVSKIDLRKKSRFVKRDGKVRARNNQRVHKQLATRENEKAKQHTLRY